MVHERQVAVEEEDRTNDGPADGTATDQPFKMDGTGQMEINNIDTPMGEKAEAFLMAVSQFDAAENAKGAAELALMEEMKNTGIRTLSFKGERIRYTPGHQTPDKLKFVATNA